MDDDSLIKAVARKSRLAGSSPAGPVSDSAIEAAERAIGASLPPLYCRLLREIGNGGYGPGLGLIGLRGGWPGTGGQDAITLRQFLWSDDPAGPPGGVLPLCDWGDAMWSCIDVSITDGEVLSVEEKAIVDTGETLRTWLESWIKDEPLLERMQRFEWVESVNPFTKQVVRRRRRVGLNGKPYIRR